MSTSPISVTLANKTIEKMDKARGLAKRSTFIDSILSNYLDNLIENGKINSQTKNTQKSNSRSVR
jgi:metal-responsive CopG/Arc/MetJ family transcriptional regulator